MFSYSNDHLWLFWRYNSSSPKFHRLKCCWLLLLLLCCCCRFIFGGFHVKYCRDRGKIFFFGILIVSFHPYLSKKGISGQTGLGYLSSIWHLHVDLNVSHVHMVESVWFQFRFFVCSFVHLFVYSLIFVKFLRCCKKLFFSVG